MKDDLDFTVWFLTPSEVRSAYKNDANIRGKLQANKMHIFKYHGTFGEAHGYTPDNLAEFGRNSYKRLSKWKRTTSGKYLRVQESVEDLMDIPMDELERKVLNERPHLHKMHPIPDLSNDRWEVHPEKFADETEWFLTWSPTLFPATVAYARRTEDDTGHREKRPALERSNLLSFIAHAMTNMARSARGIPRSNNDFVTAVTNNGHSITRDDGWEDLVYLPSICMPIPR